MTAQTRGIDEHEIAEVEHHFLCAIPASSQDRRVEVGCGGQIQFARQHQRVTAVLGPTSTINSPACMASLRGSELAARTWTIPAAGCAATFGRGSQPRSLREMVVSAVRGWLQTPSYAKFPSRVRATFARCTTTTYSGIRQGWPSLVASPPSTSSHARCCAPPTERYRRRLPSAARQFPRSALGAFASCLGPQALIFPSLCTPARSSLRVAARGIAAFTLPGGQ